MIAGLGLTALSMFAMAFLDHLTPFWWLVILMLLVGIGGSLFGSPNMKAVMNTAPPHRRGIAAGTRTMLMNVGSMLSMAIAIPMVLPSTISQADMYALFLKGGGMSSQGMAIFENGLHQAFFLFFGISVVAFVISLIKVEPVAETIKHEEIAKRGESN